MATVRKRTWKTAAGEAREAWIVTYADKTGRHQETFPTKKAASDWMAQTIVDIRDGVHTAKRNSVTVEDAGEAWIAEAKAAGLEASTVRQYRQHLDLHIKPLLGATKKLSELETETIAKFCTVLLANGRTRAMAKKVISSLGSIIVDAKMPRNVVHAEALQGHKRRQRGIESRREEQIEAGKDFPLKPELHAILDAAKAYDATVPPVARKWHALILTAAFTGLRASELRGLRWKDVDTKRKILTVRQRADRWNVIGPLKSKSAYRTVPLAGGVARALDDWRPICPKGELDLVFPNRVGKVETLPTLHHRGLGPIQVKAGISTSRVTPKYGMHSFRHFAASLFCEYLPPKRVQALIGHSTIAMTLDVYTHLFPNPDGDAAVMSRIEEQVFLPAA
jgi:integrase